MHEKINSICIPRVNNDVTKEYIQNIFKKMNVANIIRIFEIPLRDDSGQKRIIINLKWYNNEKSVTMRNTLLEQKSLKLVYNMPWYWKIVITATQYIKLK
jgi:hypothetical protein